MDEENSPSLQVMFKSGMRI